MQQAAKDVGPATAVELLDGGALLIDVREPRELAAASFDVEGMVNIPLSEFQARWEEIPRDRPVIIACEVGGRSLQATMFLRHQGFDNVSNLVGGIARWSAEGLPVRRSR